MLPKFSADSQALHAVGFELRRIALDIDLAKSELAWHPWTHLEDGLKETVAFLRGV